MKYLPLADRVIVQPAEENKRTPTGLYIPDMATQQKHVAYGTIIAVGTGRANAEGKTVPLHVKCGDIVCFPRTAPGLIPIIDADGNEDIVFMLREADIVAIVLDMPQPSLIVDRSGAPLSISPVSLAKADSSYESEEQLVVAERAGWTDVGEHQDESA